MTRVLGLVGAALVAFVAFLGGHALAGNDDGAADATPRSSALAGSAPAFIAATGRAASLPVISVRELPVLAPPHRARVTKKAPTQATVAPTQATVAPIIKRAITPTVKKPKPNPPAGNGNGGYFDDSG